MNSFIPSTKDLLSFVRPQTLNPTQQQLVRDKIGALSGIHTHGNITNAGAIGSTANLPLITGASGVIQVGSFGTTANTFCQGNDSRLSDARTPTAHNHDAAQITTGNLTKSRQHAQTAYRDEQVVFTEGIRLASASAPWGPGHIYESSTDLVLAGNTGISFRYATGNVFGGLEIARLTNTLFIGPNYLSTVAAGNDSYLQFTQLGVNSWSFGNRINQNFVLNNGGAFFGEDVVTVAPSGNTTFLRLVIVGIFIVATLPSASANQGAFAQVTDSNSTTNGTVVAGGGSNRVPVFSNGTNWIIK